MLERMPSDSENQRSTPAKATSRSIPAATTPAKAASPSAIASRATAGQIAGLCVIGFVALNVVFYLLSSSYFASQIDNIPGVGAMPKYNEPQVMQIRTAFAVFSGLIAAASFAAGVRPRMIGHALPVLLGIGYFIAGASAFAQSAPAVVGVTLVVSGVFCPLLAAYSLRGSRAAWSFLVSLCGVFALIAFFAAPKIREAIGVGLWTTMILPGMNVVSVFALLALRGDYLERPAKRLAAVQTVR